MDTTTTLATQLMLETPVPADTAALDRWGVEVLPEFVWAFQAEAPWRLSALTRAIVDGSAHQVVWNARRLKNNALNVGAVRLAEVCNVIEQQAQLGYLQLTTQLTILLESEYEEARQSLTEIGD